MNKQIVGAGSLFILTTFFVFSNSFDIFVEYVERAFDQTIKMSSDVEENDNPTGLLAE